MRELRDRLNIPHFHAARFRRYFSTTMAKLEVPIDITEAILCTPLARAITSARLRSLRPNEPMARAMENTNTTSLAFSTSVEARIINVLRSAPARTLPVLIFSLTGNEMHVQYRETASIIHPFKNIIACEYSRVAWAKPGCIAMLPNTESCDD